MKKFLTYALIGAVALSIAATGCKKAEKKTKGKVELTYVEWSSEVASTNVVKAVLQERLGYEVKIIPVSASAMWTAVAEGDKDAMVGAWLPITQKHYLDQTKDKIDNLGPNLVGTRVGLVVPQYVDITSIGDLEAKADKFKGKIIGIDPGAGMMSTTEQVLKDYNLKSFKIVEGSGASMTAALADALKNKEWIVVTGWTPHWKFARWKLKYLEDPKSLYGKDAYISTIARKGLKKDMPEVYNFLDKFNWTADEMAALMVENEKKGSDPYANAVKWINDNKAKVDSWLK